MANVNPMMDFLAFPLVQEPIELEGGGENDEIDELITVVLNILLALVFIFLFIITAQDQDSFFRIEFLQNPELSASTIYLSMIAFGLVGLIVTELFLPEGFLNMVQDDWRRGRGMGRFIM